MFVTTRWSIVVAAGAHDGSRQAETALELLCQTYWQPIYTFIRRRGYPPEEAEDLTQSYIARLLERKEFHKARPDRGRFRTFLLTTVSHFLSHERERQYAKKRGGGELALSLDFENAEKGYRSEPVASGTPQSAFERQWALTILKQTMEQLRTTYASRGREHLFEVLKGFITTEAEELAQAEAARLAGTSVENTRVEIARLRGRYRKQLKKIVLDTLESPAELDGELAYLFSAMSK